MLKFYGSAAQGAGLIALAAVTFCLGCSQPSDKTIDAGPSPKELVQADLTAMGQFQNASVVGYDLSHRHLFSAIFGGEGWYMEATLADMRSRLLYDVDGMMAGAYGAPDMTSSGVHE
jgi:hypothetical protein